MKIINKYINFLLESKLELLSESNIYLTDKFINILKDVNSPISQKLIDLYGRDIDTNIELVDAELSKDDTVLFTTGKGINFKLIHTDDVYRNTTKELLKSKVHCMPGCDTVYGPSSGTIGTIVRKIPIEELLKICGRNGCLGSDSLRERYLPPYGGLVEFKWYSNDLKPGVTEYYIVTTMRSLKPEIDHLIKKSEIKIGRLVKKIFSKIDDTTPSDKEIEDFVNKYKSVIQVTNDAFSRFKIVSGEDIRKYYYYENYFEQSRGSLGGSCMKSGGAQSYLDIYTNNPDKVSLLIFKSKDISIDKICGRALLWKDNKGRTIMDRIYTNNSADEELFKEYAIRNKYLYKLRQSYSDDTLMFNHITVSAEDNKVIIELPPMRYTYYPYLDTLKYYNPDTGFLSNKKELIDAKYFFDRTGGGYNTV